MKQLLLYFLFFVISAIILVQCAKFFPSTGKNDIETPLIHNNNVSTTYIDSKNVTDDNISKVTKEAGLKTDNIMDVPNGIPSSYFWAAKASRTGAIYKPYMTFKSHRPPSSSRLQSN